MRDKFLARSVVTLFFLLSMKLLLAVSDNQLAPMGVVVAYADNYGENAGQLRLKRAEVDACRSIEYDRERLLCFDLLLDTPFYYTEVEEIEAVRAPEKIYKDHPQEWRLAERINQSRPQNYTGFWTHIEKYPHYDALYFTQPVEDLGILVFSCVNNISRIEVMLDEPLQSGIIPVSVTARNQFDKRWLLDDTGYILREGRGIPSIDIMRDMIGLSAFTLQIKDRRYTIPLGPFASQVRDLQIMCHWR